jgi:hypothetical protein
VTKADLLVERGARRLTELADKAAARGDGVGTWLSDELRTDAAFLRKLKPSLIKARAKGQTPRSNGAPAADIEASMAEPPRAEAPNRPEPAAPPPPPPPSPPAAFTSKKSAAAKKRKRGGPPPIAIVGAAFVAGIVIAKVVDWRGSADSRD